MKLYHSSRYPRALLGVALLLLNGFPIGATNAKSKKQADTADSAQSLNVADFGAVGDGVADDGPAFQSALDALASAGGGSLFVPAGRYLIATSVTKDFSGTDETISIQGVPSDTMPAPVTAPGDQLSKSLDLVSEIIPATGSVKNAFTLSNLHELTIEHLAFTGRESEITDAYITLSLSDINRAIIHHCEFYGISTFGLIAGQGGGNVIRAVRTDLSIRQSSVLGSTANSGAYAPIVENIEWKGFSISNSIFIDYGQRSFYGKMGLGAPLSWINIAAPADKTPESSLRQVVIQDTFLDEGGWVGITAYPQFWGPFDNIDLLYISGLKMNVSNFGTAGNQFYDVQHVFIENSYYGWSKNTGAAVDIYRTQTAILDRLTCTASADRIRADARTDRLTVINSDFDILASLAPTTTVLETSPEEDPVQYVRQQFLSILGTQPDPASHFYWSDLLLRCGNDATCRNTTQTKLNEFLEKRPDTYFSLTGNVSDEEGDPISGVAINLSGSQSVDTVTDTEGNFQFSGLPTSGVYTVTASKLHYTFTTSSQTFEYPPRELSVSFNARLNRHSISGRVTKANGSGVGGVKVQLLESSLIATTNLQGDYSFSGLPEGGTYTIVPSSEGAFFSPAKTTVVNLAADTSAGFTMRLIPQLMTIEDSDQALALDSVWFVTEPFSNLNSWSFSDDGNNRVMLFATNLEGVNDRAQLSMVAEDDQNQPYTLEIEFIGDLPQQGWLKQLNVKVPSNLKGKCVNVKLSLGEITSDAALLCF